MPVQKKVVKKSPVAKKSTTKKSTTRKSAPRKQKSCLDDLDKLSKSEIKAIMESQQFWDSDTEFFHQWCLDYDVLLYWEDLHKQMKRQRVIGLIASSVVGASILVAFGAAVLSKF